VKTGRVWLFVVIAALWAPVSDGQSNVSFQVMEATIGKVHAAYKSGKLTARQLV
jgi:hypothetical protein